MPSGKAENAKQLIGELVSSLPMGFALMVHKHRKPFPSNNLKKYFQNLKLFFFQFQMVYFIYMFLNHVLQKFENSVQKFFFLNHKLSREWQSLYVRKAIFRL